MMLNSFFFYVLLSRVFSAFSVVKRFVNFKAFIFILKKLLASFHWTPANFTNVVNPFLSNDWVWIVNTLCKRCKSTKSFFLSWFSLKYLKIELSTNILSLEKEKKAILFFFTLTNQGLLCHAYRFAISWMENQILKVTVATYSANLVCGTRTLYIV